MLNAFVTRISELPSVATDRPNPGPGHYWAITGSPTWKLPPGSRWAVPAKEVDPEWAEAASAGIGTAEAVSAGSALSLPAAHRARAPRAHSSAPNGVGQGLSIRCSRSTNGPSRPRAVPTWPLEGDLKNLTAIGTLVEQTTNYTMLLRRR
jgi:hypothetical protein